MVRPNRRASGAWGGRRLAGAPPAQLVRRARGGGGGGGAVATAVATAGCRRTEPADPMRRLPTPPGRTGNIATAGGPPLSDVSRSLLARLLPPSPPPLPLPVVTRCPLLTGVAVSIGAVPPRNGFWCGRGDGTIRRASLQRRAAQPRGRRRPRRPRGGRPGAPP